MAPAGCSCPRAHADPTQLNEFDIVCGIAPSSSDIVHYLKSTSTGDPPKATHTLLGVLAPVRFVIPLSSADQLRALARVHQIVISRGVTRREQFLALLLDHSCGPSCVSITSWFDCKAERPEVAPSTPLRAPFPPVPTTAAQKMSFLREWHNEISPENIYETGCAVCARLTVRSHMSVVKELDIDLGPLIRKCEGVTRLPRTAQDAPILEEPGPILYSAGVSTSNGVRSLMICPPCLQSLRKGSLPRTALANGLWVGDTPPALQGLSYVEQLVIARSRHSFCVAQVARSGQRFLAANVIIFGQPVDRLYDVLPPPRKDIEDCLAILFVGSAKPTDEDVRRIPFLVRRDVVARALNWLILNNRLYDNVTISAENLRSYPEHEPPVGLVYRPGGSETASENVPVYDSEQLHATADGPASFVVHTLSAPDLARMTYDAKIALAIKYFDSGNGALAFGHNEHPESIYHNPSLYPCVFPWLFPFGLGGFGNVNIVKRLDRSAHIRALLLRESRTFQTDRCFPFIVFNQEQIRASSQGGYLMTSRKNFGSVAERILDIDKAALDNLIHRGKRGAYVRPENDSEKRCFELMSYVDHVAGHVKGSNTTRKYQRNEIKSLVYARGVPVLFVTFAPADYKNPLCLYYCGETVNLIEHAPLLRGADDRLRAIAGNPVGAARFFHKTVELFIRCVLRVDEQGPGVFGPTEAYYGTVEAQGRLTLHLHTLLWIENSISPQELRDRILTEVDFQERLLAWLSDCHTGDFATTTGDLLALRLEDEYVIRPTVGEPRIARRLKPSVRDPATTLPLRPPAEDDLVACASWYKTFLEDVDEVVFCSNRHDPEHGKGCWREKEGYCRARFPRAQVKETAVDQESGAIRFAKTEKWINTFNPVLSELLRSNSDVTCLLSGTQVKAVIAYVTDYITKSSLSTHTFFETVRAVLDRNTETLADPSIAREQAAKAILVKIVNALSAASEIGGPAVCAHLLGNPDHYTNELFKVFYWYAYVARVSQTLPALPSVDGAAPSASDNSLSDGVHNDQAERLVIAHVNDSVVALNKVNDYVYRPSFFDSYSLYEFLRLTDVRKRKEKATVSPQEPPTAAQSGDSETSGCESDSSPAKNVARGGHRFRAGHPLRSTHGVFLRSRASAYLLNFVGRTLPRIDKGDREEYCMTMLTFFHPRGWRTGADILGDHGSWHDAFNAAQFSAEHTQIMKNMNVLYECLDARDDYSAQRRANAGSNDHAADDMIPFGSSDSQHCANDSLAFLSGEFEFTQESLADLVADGSIGKKTARHRDHMERMRRLLPDDPVGAQAVAREHVFRERPKRSTAEWKVVVARAKQAYLDKANGASSTGPTPAPGTARRPPTYGLPPIVEVLTVETMAILRSHAFDISRGPQDRDLLLLHTVIEKFSLNKQQMIAFSIAAKYLHHHETGPLRMYLGGMAGTGKSQVLLATICFLDARNESYRLLVLGPTGSSAALIGGFTYHSALGICVTSEQGFSTATTIAKLRGRIQRVSLIFIDEISMISCVDFVRINRQLAKALPESTDTFGGKAVILAGDFAQLPPPGAAPSLYSNSIGAWSKSASQYNQDCAIGKALWHQFTTVVILRQNMRQQGLSRDDADFRVALENMRYARCTAHDIALLQTRIWYPNVGDKRLMAPDFRDISIITARNAHRDAVNEMKAPAFAARCGKKLYRFVSLDTWGHSKESTSIRKAQRAYNATADPSRTSNIIPRKVQEQLWALPPSLTDHQAGVLQLCEGMPVLLKYNEATELCATNGAEAVVHCWDSQRLGTHHEVLNTLYVRLVNPPRPVQLPGLELNVIPMPRTRKSIKCTLPVDDLTVSIQREQVMVLPNFAMTDFASQGRTRPHNVCHLEDCKNHQSIYTCLSRSSSLAGTLIVGNFDFSKLRGGASGALRREFRELELLDEITRLRTEKNLPSHVNGESRGALLTAFQSWKGPRHVPDQVHEALNWSTEDIASLRPELLFDRVIEAAGLCKPTSSFERTVKRTRAENWTPVPTKKRRNALATADVSAYDINETQRAAPPSGLLWDSQNWSCAYDALLTPFFNRYKECDDAWLASVAPGNNLMQVIRHNLPNVVSHSHPTETLRDLLRDILFALQPAQFPRQGHVGTSVSDIARILFWCSAPFAVAVTVCPRCSATMEVLPDHAQCYLWPLFPSQPPLDSVASTTQRVRQFLDSSFHVNCHVCHYPSSIKTSLRSPPPLIVLDVTAMPPTEPEYVMDLPVADSTGRWLLIGCIYHGANHFVSRYLDTDLTLWFHDGALGKRECTHDYTRSLSVCGSREATHYLYVYSER